MKEANLYRDGMMGLVAGDALGCPVQFMSREAIRQRGKVTGMEGYGTYNMPEGTWTDDSSMALAALFSMIEKKTIDPSDIMDAFVRWDRNGEYTPFGQAFDQGITCTSAIEKYIQTGDVSSCGSSDEFSNGNGSLMRILPVCIAVYRYQKEHQISDTAAIGLIDSVSSLTHAHPRSKMACGIYWFLVRSIAERTQESLSECIQTGMPEAENFYKTHTDRKEWQYYKRLSDVESFGRLPESEIRSSGYVVDSLEAAVRSLITTETFAEALLAAVNLGGDTDTIAAIAGGLAGLYYGYESIPASWLGCIRRLDWILELCEKADRNCTG